MGKKNTKRRVIVHKQIPTSTKTPQQRIQELREMFHDLDVMEERLRAEQT